MLRSTTPDQADLYGQGSSLGHKLKKYIKQKNHPDIFRFGKGLFWMNLFFLKLPEINAFTNSTLQRKQWGCSVDVCPLMFYSMFSFTSFAPPSFLIQSSKLHTYKNATEDSPDSHTLPSARGFKVTRTALFQSNQKEAFLGTAFFPICAITDFPGHSVSGHLHLVTLG